MPSQKNTFGNKGNASTKRKFFTYEIIHICSREALLVYFTGVLQVEKRISLCGIVVAQHMGDTTVERKQQLRYYKMDFGGLLYLITVNYMCLHALSVTRHVTSPNETKFL